MRRMFVRDAERTNGFYGFPNNILISLNALACARISVSVYARARVYVYCAQTVRAC